MKSPAYEIVDAILMFIITVSQIIYTIPNSGLSIYLRLLIVVSLITAWIMIILRVKNMRVKNK